MSTLAEMRDELRKLRREHPEHKAVSKMRKADISSMIQKLKVSREETPNVAATGSAPAKVSRAAVESVKKAKAAEFPSTAADAPVVALKPAKGAKATPLAKAKAAKGVVVSENSDVAAKKPRGKKAAE
jgi:hypothetical protein